MAKAKLYYPKSLARSLKDFWKKNKVNKAISVVIILILVAILLMYGIAQWYILSNDNGPTQYGVSFIPDYAQSLGLNPEQTMDALLSINVKEFRIVSYWSDIEPTKGNFDFSQLDWEFAKAQAHHAKIILVLGLRQPRWPECHEPNWVNTSEPTSTWQPELEQAMTKVVDRYKNSPSLEDYQLENEYFLKGFGNCTDYSRQRYVDEFNLVKSLDPNHPIIISRSNNSIGIPIGQPHGDLYGISIYKRVWDANVTHRYFEYPWPAWYYGFLAGVQKIFLHKDMVVTEMQGEAWPPNGKGITQISLAEQNKSLNAQRLQGRFNFGKATGMKQVEMWGAEYWYYRMQVLHDPSLWDVAKKEFNANQ